MPKLAILIVQPNGNSLADLVGIVTSCGGLPEIARTLGHACARLCAGNFAGAILRGVAADDARDFVACLRENGSKTLVLCLGSDSASPFSGTPPREPVVRGWLAMLARVLDA